MTLKFRQPIFVILGLCATLSACASSPSFQAPSEGATTALAPQPPDSQVTLQAALPFSEMRAAIAAHLPAQTPLSGSGALTCARIPSLIPLDLKGKETCANYAWSAVMTPEGGATVVRQGDALRIEQPVRIDGRGGLSGDLAKALSLTGKPFSAHLVPGAIARVTWVSVSPARRIAAAEMSLAWAKPVISPETPRRPKPASRE